MCVFYPSLILLSCSRAASCIPVIAFFAQELPLLLNVQVRINRCDSTELSLHCQHSATLLCLVPRNGADACCGVLPSPAPAWILDSARPSCSTSTSCVCLMKTARRLRPGAVLSLALMSMRTKALLHLGKVFPNWTFHQGSF